MPETLSPSPDRLLGPWIVFACFCTTLMWMLPGQETVPYHLAWIGLALAYGIEAWEWRRTVAAILVYAVVTGGVLVTRAATGAIVWGEIAEIPLMPMLVLVVVWNIRKRHLAFATLSRMARHDALRAAQRERVSRMTSHEMRTPATIASGYAEILLAQETDPSRRNDLWVIRDELARLVQAGDRLIRTIRMQDHVDLEAVELDLLLCEVVERWSVLAERNWVVDAEPIRHWCSPERLRACLDTLIENAVRYTEIGDTVRILGQVVGGRIVIGVADSGPGIDPMLVQALSRGEVGTTEPHDAYIARDPKAQTGLGLALVRAAAEARGGGVVAGRSAEGGALVLMALPAPAGGLQPLSRAHAAVVA